MSARHDPEVARYVVAERARRLMDENAQAGRNNKASEILDTQAVRLLVRNLRKDSHGSETASVAVRLEAALKAGAGNRGVRAGELMAEAVRECRVGQLSDGFGFSAEASESYILS